MTPTLLGLDVGVATMVMAALDADGRARVVPNAEGDDVTDTALHFYDEDGVIVGREASDARHLEPDTVIIDVVGALGTEEERIQLLGRTWSGQELVSLLVRKLRDDAICLRRELLGAVLAAPAWFDSADRAALQEACELAQLPVLGTVPRTTAALVGHGLDALPERGRLMVVDVGELGVDVGLVQRDGDEIVELGSLSDTANGRRRWLHALRQQLIELLPVRDLVDPDHGPVTLQRVSASAHEVLRRLSHHSEAVLRAGVADRLVTIPVQREAFLKDTWPLGVAIGRLARQAAELAGDRRRPDAVLLVGIGSRSPGVRRALHLAMELRPFVHELPHGVVARGAAIVGVLRHQADHPGLRAVPKVPVGAPNERIEPIESAAATPAPSGPSRGAVITLADSGHTSPVHITDAATHTLGMLVVDESGVERVTAIIPAGTPLPATFHGRFHYAYDNMMSVRVEVTEGEGTERSAVRVIGDVHLDKLPPRPRGTPIDVAWHFDAARVLRVEVTDLETGRIARSEINFRGALTQEERSEAVQRANRLHVG